MAEIEAGPSRDVDNSALPDETGQPESQLPALIEDAAVELADVAAVELVDEATAELPADYYVTLQPLTLDLVAVQLERIGIKCDLEPDRIEAHWQSFVIVVRIMSEDVLTARAVLRQLFPAESATALAGRCNWWNQSHTFLKASTTTVVGHTQPSAHDGESRPAPYVQLCLDLDLPLPVGAAPVQLQALFRKVVQNVGSFEQQARLDNVILQAAW
jgi:hypothetical protein